jgi:hypothetical protein
VLLFPVTFAFSIVKFLMPEEPNAPAAPVPIPDPPRFSFVVLVPVTFALSIVRFPMPEFAPLVAAPVPIPDPP